VRIIPSHEKWPTQGRPFPCRSDIRVRKQKQFSRPMTGHTPRKLPSFDAISRIIAVRAQYPLHALDYDTTTSAICQALFRRKSQTLLDFFSHFAEKPESFHHVHLSAHCRTIHIL
jgi:hypothetical protein